MKTTFPLLILISLLSCRPSEQTDIAEEILLFKEGGVDDIVFFDQDHGLAVGGVTWHKGFMGFTQDGGNTWQVDSVGNKRIFAVDACYNNFMSGGIDGHIYTGELTTSTLNWDFYRPRYWEIIQDISYCDRSNIAIAVGGNRYGYGFCQRLNFSNGDIVDTLCEFNKMIEGVAHPKAGKFVAVGFGMYAISEDGGKNWERKDLDGYIFKAIDFLNEQEGLMCAYNGDIFKTSDSGYNWTRVNGTQSFLNRGLLHELKFDEKGTAWVCGERSSLFYSDDLGSSWTRIKFDENYDFTSLDFQADHIWLSTSEGQIVKIHRP
jgi:hypothetical protein